MKKERKENRVSVSKSVLAIAFAVSILCMGNSAFSQNETTKEVKYSVLTEADEMPVFPGGEEALMKFMSDNIQYPAVAKEKNIQGKVFISFVVEETGKVTQVAVVKGVNELLDNEAIRVVKSLPNFKPGKDKEKNVAVQFTIPVSFKLK